MDVIYIVFGGDVGSGSLISLNKSETSDNTLWTNGICFEMDGLIFNFTVSSKTDPFQIIGMADNPFCFTDNSRDF